MNAMLWNKAKSLFQDLIVMPVESRGCYLQTHCQDPEVRREVMQMINAEQSDAKRVTKIMARGVGSLFYSSSIENQTFPKNGDNIGEYKIVKMIGCGGMGTVFLAKYTNGNKSEKVAIKFSHEHQRLNPSVSCVEHEYRILKKLSHKNIVKILDNGITTSGKLYIVMEYVEGDTIDKYCNRLQLPVHKRLEIFKQVCRSIHHIHKNFIIHNDIKPSNVLVTTMASVKILDFGIASWFHPETSSIEYESAQPGFHVLTPESASPEQIKGEQLTIRSDIYSLGVLLSQLLSAAADAPNSHLAKILYKSHENNPNYRYPSVIHLLDDIEHYYPSPLTAC